MHDPSTRLAQPPAESDLSRQLNDLHYPLQIRFKLIALATQASVTDANGHTVLFTKQKMFKLREHVEIYADKSKSTLLAHIRAGQWLDWSARYEFTDAQGQPVGAVGRKGWRSIWRAHYEVFNPGSGTPDYSIREENPGAKLMDGILGGIPVVGMASGYLFHPRYLITRRDGQPVMRLTKQAAFWEGRFSIDKLAELEPREELNLLLSFLMLLMLERKRG